jgi:excisionase family DNA binding protein
VPPGRSQERATPEWLSLGPASRALGVDPDTLRRWADTGRIASYTTPGGHRRFSRRALRELAAGGGDASTATLVRLGATPRRIAGAYRRSYGSGPDDLRTHPARAAVGDPDRSVFRDDGRALVAALVRFLDTADPDARVAAESDAGVVADDLGRRSGNAGISLAESVGLFVAGRRPLFAELAALARGRDLPAAQLGRLFEDASAILDRLLLRFIAAHLAVSEGTPQRS